MVNNAIKRGLKVQVEVDTGIRKSIIDCYIIEPEYDRLVLSFPESKQDLIPYLMEGCEIKAFVYTFGGILIINSIVFDAPFEGQFVIEYNEENQLIQRRKYLRVPFINDFFLNTTNGNIKARTIDICGGGIRFESVTELPDSTEFQAQIKLSLTDKFIKITGFVSKKHFYRENEYLFEFTDINEKDRDSIIQKCVELDRVQNKKY